MQFENANFSTFSNSNSLKTDFQMMHFKRFSLKLHFWSKKSKCQTHSKYIRNCKPLSFQGAYVKTANPNKQ
jgi:hypothetical protein